MINHIFIGTNDVAAARRFYDATMGVLGHAGHELPHGTAYVSPESTVVVATPADGKAASCANGFTLGLKAADYNAVDEWHRVGLAHGGTDAGAPGFRAQSPGNMYGAYLRDPEGHKVCAYTPNVGAKE